MNSIGIVKLRTWAMGKKLKELAEAVDISYPRFIQIINGLAKKPLELDSKVEAVLKGWESKSKQKLYRR